MCFVCVNRSIRAPVRTVSPNTSFHLSKVRFEVIMIEPLSFLFDRRLKRISAPLLSKDI